MLNETDQELFLVFEAAMLSESDLPEGYTWEEQKSISAGWYSIMSDTSIYDDEETTAMLVFLKNGLYEGGITFKGKDLDYSYCNEEAIRLSTLIWERLAD